MPSLKTLIFLSLFGKFFLSFCSLFSQEQDSVSPDPTSPPPPQLAANYQAPEGFELSQEKLDEIKAISIQDVIPTPALTWNTPPIPAQFPLEGMRFQVTCQNPAAKNQIIAGIHFLHLSWDERALGHFAAALKLDSSAPLAWWGVAMCLLPENNEFAKQRNKALEKLIILRPQSAFAWEQELMDSLQVFPALGATGSLQQLDKLLTLKAEDLNAQLLRINLLNDGFDINGSPEPLLKLAQSQLKTLRQQYPNHPLVLRYALRVHFPAPQNALKQAAPVLEEISPALLSPWLYYEAAQLAYSLGNYTKSQEFCQQGRALQNQWLKDTGANLADAPTLAKLAELEVHALIEQGKITQAQKLAQTFTKLSLSQFDRKHSAGRLELLHRTSILPSLIEERFENWQAAIDKLPIKQAKEEFNLESELHPWVWEARRIYYQGELSASQGDLTGLNQALGMLNDLGATYQAVALPLAKNKGYLEQYFRQQRIIDQHLKFLSSRIAQLQGNQELALLKLRQAIEAREISLRHLPPLTPREPRQQIGLLCLQLRDHELAKRAFNQALQNASANQATAWLGLAESYHALGNDKAKQALEIFEQSWNQAETEHPLLKPYLERAVSLKEKMGILHAK